MSDAEAAVASDPAPSTPKKAAKGKRGTAAKKPRAKASHPKISDMVNAAIKDLKERGGSSLQAIKKYISANYKVDAEKLAPFIKKYLKSAVTSGSLVQTKGKGASGSFKLAGASSGDKAAKASKPKSPKEKSSPKPKKAKPVAKKPSSPKKVAAKESPSVAKKAKAPKPASPSKAKTVAKSPTKKPKAPKPKKTTAAKKSPKKAAAKK